MTAIWQLQNLISNQKKIYYGDSLKSSAPRDLIWNINGFFGNYGVTFENRISYIKEIPCQKATLDCGIVVPNYIEKEIGICNRSWNMQQSKYFRIRYLGLILNYNLENFDFPLDIGKSIETTFPLQSHSL